MTFTAKGWVEQLPVMRGASTIGHREGRGDTVYYVYDGGADPKYRDAVRKWREARDERLRAAGYEPPTGGGRD